MEELPQSQCGQFVVAILLLLSRLEDIAPRSLLYSLTREWSVKP